MNVAVVYKSKYGSTEKYAKWISEELCADLIKNASLKVDTLEKYDVIIYGGGLYAGGLNGLSALAKNYEKIKDKKLIIFSCGLADPKNTVNVERIKKEVQKEFVDSDKANIKIFNLRGGIDYKELTLVHRGMMKMLKSMISKKKPEEVTEEDKYMLETYGKKVNFIDKDNIKELVSYVKTL